MIVVDASAVVAILTREDGFDTLSARLMASDVRRINPVSYVEALMALTRIHAPKSTPTAAAEPLEVVTLEHFRPVHPSPAKVLDAYLERTAIRLHAIDAEQAKWAQHAFLTFGKGRHPAKLNLGDCFSYAAAKALNAPLLYVGGDFAKTDIRAA